jgi:uncharacterized RDD family membrane protein YckC
MTDTDENVSRTRVLVPDLAPDIEQLQGRRAGFVTRALAYSIDALIVIIGVPAILYGLAIVQGMLRLEAPTYPPDIPNWLSASISVLWTFWYFVGLWWATGRTIGAIVMGMRVVGRKHRRVGIVAATVRFWVMILTLFVVGEVWLIFAKSRLALHDRAARTQVIYDNAPKHRESKVEVAPDEETVQPK